MLAARWSLLSLLLVIGTQPLVAQEQGQTKKTPVKLTKAEVDTSERQFGKTPQGDLLLHIYSPPNSKNTDQRPVIVFFFGGGWKGGSYLQFVPQAEYFASRGLVAICADYRIASKHATTPDKCVEDAKAAIRWVRSHAKDLGIDPNKIIASGGSAGGHLAAATALVEGFNRPDDDATISCVPNALVLFNPALNHQTVILDAKGTNIGKAFWPTLGLKKGTPPTILFYGTKDAMLAQGKEFLQKSQALGNRVELYTAAEMGHGFFNRSPWLEVTTKQAEVFLTELGYLSGPSTLVPPTEAPSLVRVKN